MKKALSGPPGAKKHFENKKNTHVDTEYKNCPSIKNTMPVFLGSYSDSGCCARASEHISKSGGEGVVMLVVTVVGWKQKQEEQ